MKLEFNVVRMDNEDVIATSGNAVVGSCSWETIKTTYALNYFNTDNPDTDDGKSFLYNGEEHSIGPDYWNTFSGDKFYDDKGNLLGIIENSNDLQYFVSGKHYHAGSNEDGDELWVECTDPSHYRN